MAKPGKGVAPLKFGRYNALTKLGQGAMATVYLAEDPALNRMVAIKVIHSHLSSNANLLDRFTVEAKTAASLRNPNIVEIFDYGLEDDAQYLVMEYIDGPNLQFVLNLLGGQPMAPEVCAAVICQAADGLVTAERFGVVHRDIKPENMMFKSEGVLKIADFGIAHISEQNLTQTGSILGSPNFMSPEQIDGKKPTHMTDMFSLGAVFYYCLAGRKPFNGANIPSIMRQITDLPHEPVSAVNPGADPALEKLVDILLQKDPENRGKGARWLSLQLRSYLNQKGLLDLPEATKEFLDKTGHIGNQTVIDLTPAPGPDESLTRPKSPLKPGMRVEKPKSGTGIRPGTGLRPGTGSSVRQGTWQAGASASGGVDFNGNRPGTRSGTRSGTQSGSPKKNILLWTVGGLLGAGILAAALFIVMGGGSDKRAATGAVTKTLPPPPDVSSVLLQPGSMELQQGQSRRFMVEVQPSDASGAVRWESANPQVATVQDGEVLALAPGQTAIRAISMQNGGKSGSADVIVTAKVPDPTYTVKPIDPGPSGDKGSKGKPGDGKDRPGNPTIGGATVDSIVKGVINPDSAKPVPTKAILTITSAPPFAEVIIDGRFMGTTPVKGRELPPGRHKVQITHRSFPPVDTVINLVPGEKTIRFRLFR